MGLTRSDGLKNHRVFKDTVWTVSSVRSPQQNQSNLGSRSVGQLPPVFQGRWSAANPSLRRGGEEFIGFCLSEHNMRRWVKRVCFI